MTLTTLDFELHDYMRKSLEVAGLGVEEIADRLDVSRNTVSRWINGRGKPSTPVLMAWATLTGVDYEVFAAVRPKGLEPLTF